VDLRRACPRCLGSCSQCHALQSVPLPPQPCVPSPTRRAPLPSSRSEDPPRLRGLVPRGSPLHGATLLPPTCPRLSWASLLERPRRRSAQARTTDGTATSQGPWRPTVCGTEAPHLAPTRPLRPPPTRAPRRVAQDIGWHRVAALPALLPTPSRVGRPPSLREDPRHPGQARGSTNRPLVLGAPRHRRVAPSAVDQEANLMGRGRVRRAKVVARLSSPPRVPSAS
jgi:hypothetical protein